MFYNTSKGEQLVIADMAYPHLKSATAKLKASIDTQPHRQEELAAMEAELAEREANYVPPAPEGQG